MLTYPDISPVAFSLGSMKVHWYGLMYILGFIMAWLIAVYRVKVYQLDWTIDQISDLIFYAAMGVIIGGRLGYFLFYASKDFLFNPLIVIEFWKGGMSFHGGFLGCIIALLLYAKKINKSFFEVSDLTALIIPLGLAAGRIGNFINGELWGRPTNVAWAMVFPHVDRLPRHPSQLYEVFLEGILLFAIIWFFARKPRANGSLTGLFFISYGLLRSFAECFRQPDAHLGFLAFNWLTMGMLLSFPMIIGGMVIFLKVSHNKGKTESLLGV